MALKLIKQPKGKFGFFDTFSSRIILVNTTEDELIEFYANRAAERARAEMKENLKEVKTKQYRLYDSHMTVTLKTALQEHNYGNASTDSAKLLDKEIRKMKKALKPKKD